MATMAAAAAGPDASNATDHQIDHDDDSASDVSMAQESDDDESDGDPPATSLAASSDSQQDDQPLQNNHEVGEAGGLGPSRKRKSLADVPDAQTLPDHEQVKKVKTQQPGHLTLPAELWHHVFTFCPPRTLGSLLLVNRLFHSYLHPLSTIRRDQTNSPLPAGALARLQPNSIWQASRRRFWPSMPSPLQDQTELYMWQLSCATSCQFCGKPTPAQHRDSKEPWQLGPGKEGVAVVWAFAARSCGLCLLSNSIKVCKAAV